MLISLYYFVFYHVLNLVFCFNSIHFQAYLLHLLSCNNTLHINIYISQTNNFKSKNGLLLLYDLFQVLIHPDLKPPTSWETSFRTPTFRCARSLTYSTTCSTTWKRTMQTSSIDSQHWRRSWRKSGLLASRLRLSAQGCRRETRSSRSSSVPQPGRGSGARSRSLLHL